MYLGDIPCCDWRGGSKKRESGEEVEAVLCWASTFTGRGQESS
jgi:hypothetical protein